jgi:uncharacterized protein (TIGR01777 family)
VPELSAKGYRITALSRNTRRAAGSLPGVDDFREYAPGFSDGWIETVSGAHAVVHLAAESIGGARWNARVKKRIADSRIMGTRGISGAIAAAASPPEVFVSVSGIGYYGDTGDRPLSEDAPAGDDFLARLCEAWENEALAAGRSGTRVAVPRFGIVLSGKGGALPRLALPIRMFAGGPLGNGRQWLPWIHIDDAVRIIMFALENPDIRGPFAAVAPDPVRNREFGATVARVLKRPFCFPVPAFLLRALIGEFAGTLLGGQRISPERLIEAGFEFLHPRLEPALVSILPADGDAPARR